MSDDDLFRWVLILAFVLVLPVGVYHRLKAATSEKLDRRQEGLFLLISIRLLAGVGMEQSPQGILEKERAMLSLQRKMG